MLTSPKDCASPLIRKDNKTMLLFVVEQETYEFPENNKLTLEEQAEYCASVLRKIHPEHTNLYKSKFKEKCWHLFQDILTITEISDATGLTYHGVLKRINDVQCYERLPAAITDTPVKRGEVKYKISFKDFSTYDFDRGFKSKNVRCKRYSYALEGKDDVIRSYHKDGLPLTRMAKALGVSRNTLISYIKKFLPDLQD
jgi:hypothetical protein